MKHKLDSWFMIKIMFGWLLAGAILLFWLLPSMCRADQSGQIIIDAPAFIPDSNFHYASWRNATGQTIYIHSVELKMFTEMNDQGTMASGAELMRSSADATRNGSYLVWGSLYCVVTDPTLLERVYDPNPVTLMPGEGIVLRYYASYPDKSSAKFFDGVIIWYSVGTP